MKKLDPKFLITCGVIVLIPILILVILFSIRGCSGGKSYTSYETMMINSAKKYAKNHKMLPQKGKQIIVKLDDLVSDGLKSPEKAMNDSTCNGSVMISNNSNSISEEKYYSYIPYLECNNYKTEYIKDYLMKDVTTKDSGLYKVGEEYIFKGNKTNNYLSFYGTIYRIIKIDANGNLKLIKQQSQEVSVNWDNKYNIDKNEYSGVNNYRDSVIIDRLVSDYKSDKTLTEDAKTKIVPQSVCIGKRTLNDLSVGITNECTEKIDNQVLTLPSVTDFTLASYDENCKQIGDLSCTNYNYMADFIDYTWTVDTVSDDNSLVYYIDSVGADTETANKYKKYNWVMYINSEELYQGGKGTEKDPYIIK